MKLLARLLFVAALLIAQTGGVVHEIWHSATDLAADGKAPQKSPLCDFHTALGSLSVALSCAHAAPEPTLEGNSSLDGVAPRSPRVSLLTAQSRDPPALL